MNGQNNTKSSICANSCVNDTFGNCAERVLISDDGIAYALISQESSKYDITFEFLPLEMWVTDQWEETDIVKVVVGYRDQEGYSSPDSFSQRWVNPGDDDYDYGHEEKQIIDNIEHYFRKEVSHV